MATIADLIERLGEVKAKRAGLYKEYKGLEEDENALRHELQDLLVSTGLKSAKGSRYSASLTEKPQIVINSETEVLDWLDNTPNIEKDFYVGLKKTEFKTLASTMLKETGEVIPGTDVLIQETLSIRANPAKKGAMK